MKKRLLSTIIGICTILLLLFQFTSVKADATTDASWYIDHTGTSADPYILYDTEDLEELAQIVNEGTNDFNGKYIKLADSFDNSVSLKTVIGDYSAITGGGYAKFSGIFDGNNKIVNIDFDVTSATTTLYTGMFGFVDSASISNLIVVGSVDINVTKKVYVGGLIGYANNSNITNCGSKVNITTVTTNQHAYCGDLVGALVGGTISESYTTGNVSATVTTKTAMASGISGVIQNSGTISNCYSRGNMTAKSTTGTSYASGIVGINQDTILSCYSTGTITATSTSGTKVAAGICSSNTGTIRKCYSVLDTFVGTNTGTVETCYKINSTTQELLKKSADSFVGTSVSLIDQLNNNADKFNLASWVIKKNVNDGYPIQRLPMYAASIGDTKYRTIQ